MWTQNLCIAGDLLLIMLIFCRILNHDKAKKSVDQWKTVIASKLSPELAPLHMKYAAESALCWHSGWSTGTVNYLSKHTFTKIHLNLSP